MKRIKWYKIIYLVFNIYAIGLTIHTLNHINTLKGYNNQRLIFLTILMYGAMLGGSTLAKKLYLIRKEK